MESSDFGAFSKMLSLTSEQYGRPMSPELVRFYFDGLSHLGIADIRAGLNRHVRNTEVGQYMPKIADIIRACEGGTQSAAYLALRSVQNAFSQVGSWQSVAFEDKIIHSVIEDMGGWPDLCGRDMEEWQNFGSREFMRRYAILTERGVSEPRDWLPGRAEIDNVSNGFAAQPPIRVPDARKHFAVGEEQAPALPRSRRGR